MQPAATVLLRHTRTQDTHLDWMIDLPGSDDVAGGGLTTFRCGAAWPHWRTLGRVELTALPPHRRGWLDRQGPASGGRGRTLRLGRGTAWVEAVHRHGWEMRLCWPAGPAVPAGEVSGRVTRLHADRWEFVAQTAGIRGRAPGGILRGPAGIAR